MTDDRDLRAAADAFRRRAGLLSAADMQAWLDARGMTVAQWLDWVRGAVAGAADGDDPLARAMADAAAGAGTAAPPPAFDPALRMGEPGGPLPWVRARASDDCGPAALASVLSFHGRRTAIDEVRAHTGPGPASLVGLTDAAIALGAHARSIKASPGTLDTLPRPAIVHLDGKHWAVLHTVAPEFVDLVDPAAGPHRVARAAFEQRWTGYAALVAPVRSGGA